MIRKALAEKSLFPALHPPDSSQDGRSVRWIGGEEGASSVVLCFCEELDVSVDPGVGQERERIFGKVVQEELLGSGKVMDQRFSARYLQRVRSIANDRRDDSGDVFWKPVVYDNQGETNERGLLKGRYEHGQSAGGGDCCSL